MHSMQQAIARNRRREKYKRLTMRIIRKSFDYEDSGVAEKAQRVLDRCRAIVHNLSK